MTLLGIIAMSYYFIDHINCKKENPRKYSNLSLVNGVLFWFRLHHFNCSIICCFWSQFYYYNLICSTSNSVFYFTLILENLSIFIFSRSFVPSMFQIFFSWNTKIIMRCLLMTSSMFPNFCHQCFLIFRTHYLPHFL